MRVCVCVHQFKSKNPLENWRWNFKTVEDFQEVEHPNAINYVNLESLCQRGCFSASPLSLSFLIKYCTIV